MRTASGAAAAGEYESSDVREKQEDERPFQQQSSPAAPPPPPPRRRITWARGRANSVDRQQHNLQKESGELYVVFMLQRHVVARSSSESATPAEYGVAMLTSVQRAEDAVHDVAIDRQHSTNQSRRCDVLAAKAPMKLRLVAERASSVSRQDPHALLDILKKDPFETALQDAYDAVHSTSIAVCQWLGYTPFKRAYAFSTGTAATTATANNHDAHHHHHHGRILLAQPQHLSAKYIARISEGFKDCENAVRGLDALRARLPTTARLVRFASRTDVWQQRQLSSRQQSGPVSPTNSTRSLEDYYDDVEQSCKYRVDQVDDFLTEAAPLGVGVETSEVFACRGKDGDLFLTWNFRDAEELLNQADDDLAAEDEDDDEELAAVMVSATAPRPGDDDDDYDDDDKGAERYDLRERRSADSASPPRDLDRHPVLERHASATAVETATGTDSSRRNRQQARNNPSARRFSSSSSSSSLDPPTPPASTKKQRRPGPAVLAHTTIYKSIEYAQKLALDEGDEIWAVTIDDREYYYCVMEDGGDRGIQYALSRLNLDEEDCARFGVKFRKILEDAPPGALERLTE